MPTLAEFLLSLICMVSALQALTHSAACFSHCSILQHWSQSCAMLTSCQPFLTPHSPQDKKHNLAGWPLGDWAHSAVPSRQPPPHPRPALVRSERLGDQPLCGPNTPLKTPGCGLYKPSQQTPPVIPHSPNYWQWYLAGWFERSLLSQPPDRFG
ncbi:hypothetical [Yersinia pestis KIM10+]|uniref:Secreted protein n=1 Tax=Yersinia pestis TaxID=632 RepID=Q8CKI1_YERPE|nr:hypothetical [Yersinia pestis KIM10+]